MYKINIISNEGHTEVEFSNKADLLTRLSDEVSNNGKWAYLNAQVIDMDTFTEEMIPNNAEFMLTNPLVGG